MNGTKIRGANAEAVYWLLNILPTSSPNDAPDKVKAITAKTNIKNCSTVEVRPIIQYAIRDVTKGIKIR